MSVQRTHRPARIVSVVAATIIALASGTNVRRMLLMVEGAVLKRLPVCLLGLGARVWGQIEALLDPNQPHCMSNSPALNGS